MQKSLGSKKSGKPWTSGILAFALVFAGLFGLTDSAQAQQKIGYIDSEYILEQTPEYATIQQNIDRMAQEWQAEVDQKRDDAQQLFEEYQARELLYTNEERQRKQEEIMRAEEEAERLRSDYFGPEGRLFSEQSRLMEPLQERILEAVEEVAGEEGYDYVFDKKGDFLFLYAPDQFNLSDDVLRELGIDVNDPSANNTGRGR